MMARYGVNGALGLLLLAACGGKAPPPGGPTSAAAPSAAPSAATGKAGAGQVIAERQREFMAGCAEPMAKSPGYCECAWTEYRKSFSDQELTAGTQPTEEKIETVKKQISTACSSKISDETARAGWDEWCAEGKKELKPFCDCAWTEMRKHLSAAELGDEDVTQHEKFTAARAPVAKTCAAKLPEAFAKENFMSGCMEDPKLEKFCQCGWKALRSIASAAEISFDAVDTPKAEAALEKQCSKLKPK